MSTCTKVKNKPPTWVLEDGKLKLILVKGKGGRGWTLLSEAGDMFAFRSRRDAIRWFRGLCEEEVVNAVQ